MSNEIIYPNALPVGTILNGQYCIEEVLGQGGFGITYLGRDLNLEVKVAIKEYYPEGIVARDNTTRKVTVYAGDKREDFEYGAERFLDEAKILGRFQNNGYIVGVRNFFRENDTAYFVMDYIEGISFKEYLKKMDGRILYQDALALLVPIMEALEQVHETGLLHRDISPDNIYITFEGKSKLLDFGAARSTLGEHSKSLSVILKPGYAPEEQYRSKGKQGPWTDVYALSATLYMAITGMLPPDALDRLDEDELKLPSELGIEVPAYLEQALKKGLAIKAYDRYQSIKALREGLLGEANQEVERVEEIEKTEEPKVESKVAPHTDANQGSVQKLFSKASLLALREKYKKQMVLGGITLVGVVIATAGIIGVLNTKEKSTLAVKPTTDSVADNKQIALLEEEQVQDDQDKEEAAKLEAQKAQEEALRQEELKKEAVRQEIKAIADKSYTNVQLKDDKGESYTAYLYADDAAQYIASMEDGTAWSGASDGNLIVTGDFRIAYVKEDGTEIKTYDLGEDIGRKTQINITRNANCIVENQYDGQPDFMVIKITDIGEYYSSYIYVMHEGELKAVQFNEGAWYSSQMEQLGPTTFGVTDYDNHVTGLYMIDEIQYDVDTQSFSVLTSDRMMTRFNYDYYKSDNSRELTDDEALCIIMEAHEHLRRAFTFYDDFSSVSIGNMRPVHYMVDTMNKMKGFLSAYWSPTCVDALMNKYKDYFQEIDGVLYIAEIDPKPYFNFYTSEVTECKDNGNTRIYTVSVLDDAGVQHSVRYTLTYTSVGWVMFDGGSEPYLL